MENELRGVANSKIDQNENFVLNPFQVLLKIFPYGVSVFLNFLVTLAISPALTMQVVSSYGPDTSWATTFYVPIVSFLLHDMLDYAGRAVAGLIKWPRLGKKGGFITLGMSALRIMFVPFLFLCNI